MTPREVSCASAIVAMLAAFALRAFAQSDAVIVSATRFPEDAARFPASVTVLTAEDIRDSAARTLPELLGEQVGLTLKDFYGNNAAATSVDLRGFGATATQNTLILVDGRRVTDVDLSGVQWSAIPLASVERIEILRGTGAVLYGDGASAGVVNIVTRSPLKQGRRAEALGRAASYDTLEGPALRQLRQRRLSASTRRCTATTRRATARTTATSSRTSSVNLRWGPGESYFDLRLGTDSQNLRLPGARRVQPSIGLDEYAADPRGAQTPLDWSSRDGERAGVTYVTRFGGAELNVGADWRGKQQQSYFDQSGFPISRDDALDVGSFTPRLRLPVDAGGTRHRFTLGADWYAWRYDSRRSDLPQNLGQPINRVRVDQDVLGLYLQDAIELSARQPAHARLARGARQVRRERRARPHRAGRGLRHAGAARDRDAAADRLGNRPAPRCLRRYGGIRARAAELPLRQRGRDLRGRPELRQAVPDPAPADRADLRAGRRVARAAAFRCARRCSA